MKTRLTLRPGQNGTKKLVRKYGERLIAVRYRYDPVALRRLKTVELIEEDLPWEPPPPPPAADVEVLLNIGWRESGLQIAIRDAGGKWLHGRKLWQLSYRLAEAMGLRDRIVT